MQKFYVVLAALVGLGVYVLLENPLGQWGAVATAIVVAIAAAWLVTLIPGETQNDARMVAVGLSVLGWLYVVSIVLKKGGEQAEKVGVWAVVVEAILLSGPVWALIWGVRRMARNRKALQHTVPVYAGASQARPAPAVQALGTGIGFADELRASAISGVLLGYAGRILNPQTPEPERHKAFAAGVKKAQQSLGKRPQLVAALLNEIRTDDAHPAVRQLAEQMVQHATGAAPPGS